MSTYDSPYIYGEIPAQTGDLAGRVAMVTYLKNWFEEAGWAITIIPSLITMTTGATAPTFGVCGLGPSNQNFFGVGISGGGFVYTPVTDVDGCYTPSSDEDYNWSEPTALVGDVITYTDQIDNMQLFTATGYTLVGLPGGTLANSGTRHAALVEIVKKLLTPVFYRTNDNGDGSWTSFFGTPENADNISAQSYTIDFGGQLNTTSLNLGGNGFIARSESNTVDGNFTELYVYYDTSDGAGGAGSFNRVRFRMRVGSRFLDQFTEHPLVLAEEENNISVNAHGGLVEAAAIQGFIGPYNVFLEQPSLGSSSCVAWGGAFRIKRLDGELGEPNIKKALIFGVTGLSINHNPDSFRETFTPVHDMSYWIKTADNVGVGASITTVAMSGYSNTISLATQRDGIFWYGDVAAICEPWIGWPIFSNFGSLFSEPSPLFCQIPNAIVPYRSIALGATNFGDVFPFDSKLYRYYQNNRFPTTGVGVVGPGSSMAFVVSNSQIFNGISYSGLEFYEIKNVTISPAQVAKGATVVVTITAADSQDLSNGGQVLIRTSNNRISFDANLITFSPGSQTATVNLTENNLEIVELVSIQVIGKDSIETPLTITCLAV